MAPERARQRTNFLVVHRERMSGFAVTIADPGGVALDDRGKRVEPLEGGEVDRRLGIPIPASGPRARVAPGLVVAEELAQRHVVDRGQLGEARHRDLPIAALVGSEHRSLELAAGPRFDIRKREPALTSHLSQSCSQVSVVHRLPPDHPIRPPCYSTRGDKSATVCAMSALRTSTGDPDLCVTSLKPWE